jgi:shikimate dehydrogenase
MVYGLLGRTLSYSYSPRIQKALGDYSYELFEKEPEELADFLQNGEFSGLNVTIPYKKAVIPYLQELSPIAKRLGAVNTIVRRVDGTLVGHNTDYFGFSTMVAKAGIRVADKKALVLGSGGASNTAVAVLEELGAKVIVISRTGENNYNNLELHQDAALIVNATPVGMFPNVDDTPLSLDGFPVLEAVLDLNYNPSHTQLLLDAESRGLIAENGRLMLVAQAKESAEWFTGTTIPNSKIKEVHKELSSQMENIILIGMPGCGKSTVAKLLAQELQRPVVDTDEEIVRLAGCSIPEIFAKSGEEGFRRLETQVLRELGKQSGKIIATGGGCVTREENYPLLHRNGKIIWLTRDLNKLPADGRPLSQITKIETMFALRKPMYQRFADHIVSNDGYPEETVDAIRRLL